jgi:hypothetical protein
MKQDTKELREAIQQWDREAQGNDQYIPLVRWLTELYHRRGGPWCSGCGSPVVEEGDQCHSCRDGTHDPDDMKWLSNYHEG